MRIKRPQINLIAFQISPDIRNLARDVGARGTGNYVINDVKRGNIERNAFQIGFAACNQRRFRRVEIARRVINVHFKLRPQLVHHVVKFGLHRSLDVQGGHFNVGRPGFAGIKQSGQRTGIAFAGDIHTVKNQIPADIHRRVDAFGRKGQTVDFKLYRFGAGSQVLHLAFFHRHFAGNHVGQGVKKSGSTAGSLFGMGGSDQPAAGRKGGFGRFGRFYRRKSPVVFAVFGRFQKNFGIADHRFVNHHLFFQQRQQREFQFK